MMILHFYSLLQTSQMLMGVLNNYRIFGRFVEIFPILTYRILSNIWTTQFCATQIILETTNHVVQGLAVLNSELVIFQYVYGFGWINVMANPAPLNKLEQTGAYWLDNNPPLDDFVSLDRCAFWSSYHILIVFRSYIHIMIPTKCYLVFKYNIIVPAVFKWYRWNIFCKFSGDPNIMTFTS